jgi:hypothetical protein
VVANLVPQAVPGHVQGLPELVHHRSTHANLLGAGDGIIIA